MLSVRWGDQELARELLSLGTPRGFTIGTDPGCDFSCGGARSFELLDLEEHGASLQHRDGSRSSLARNASTMFELGALTFDARLVDSPPRVRGGPVVAELATVNISLLLLAAFGFFAVAAANHDAEGAELADDLSAGPTRVVKAILHNNQARQASASSSSPRKTQQKSAPVDSPSHKARTVAPSRPTGRPGKLEVAAIFKGPGAANIFGSSGLGDDLRVASTGLRTAQAGDGLGAMGAGHGVDGKGLGGLSLAGIGALGTKGGRGPGNRYGLGSILKPGPKTEVPDPEDPVVNGCTVDGKPCLDKELIRQVIRRNLASFRYCYESKLNRFPSLEGKVSMRFSLVPSGRVAAATVVQSTANNAELEQCVADRTRLLQFPSGKWNGMVVVTYPFIFKQSGK